VATELMGYDGPWAQPENLQRRNLLLRLSDGSPSRGYAITAMRYSAHWTATEHVPERAIRSGEIGRYGALSPRDGGRTRRNSLSAEWARLGDGDATSASAYVIDYGLNLYSAPSGYIGGLQGDQHEQADSRLVWGGEARHSWRPARPCGTPSSAWAPACARTASAASACSPPKGARAPAPSARTASPRPPWPPTSRPAPSGRPGCAAPALRRDEISADVTALGGQYNMGNGGSVRGGQTSPRLGLVFGPSSWPAAPSSTPTGATASTATTPAAPPATPTPPTAAPSAGCP
jgi:hypothetical protein